MSLGDISEAMERIHKPIEIKPGEMQARQTLHKLGLRDRKTGVIPGKVDPQLQFDFFQHGTRPKINDGETSILCIHIVLNATNR